MSRYACRFCIALYGLKGSEVGKLPREEAEAHVLLEHGYPKRSAQQILGNSARRQAAEELILVLGPVVAVSLV